MFHKNYCVKGSILKMSWLFGLRKDTQPNFSSIGADFNVGGGSAGEGQPPSSGGSNRGNGDSGNKSTASSYRFDSSALERAAKAARELELSRVYHDFVIFHIYMIPVILR